MSDTSSTTAATKRRQTDWLSVFAAASMFIGDDVLEGSLFPVTGTSARAHNDQGPPVTKLTAKDFGPIVFHDLDAFYQHIGKLYAALKKEKQTKNDRDLTSIRSYSTDPTPFVSQLRKFGYYCPKAKGGKVFTKTKNFHLVPDPKTVAIVSRTLTGIGYRYKARSKPSPHKQQVPSIQPPIPPTDRTVWLDVFAAVAMYIDSSVMQGSLFVKPNAEYDRIVIYSRSRFFQAAHYLYSCVIREQSTSRDLALTSIPIRFVIPTIFVAQLGHFGYRRVDGGVSLATENENEEEPEVYAKDPAFPTHISPNPERALVIYNVLKEMGFEPKGPLPKQGFGPPCHSKESGRIPNPSPTTVADTGFSTVRNHDATATATATTTGSATATMKSAVTKSIPKLHHGRNTNAPVDAATTFFGKVTIDKGIVPSTIAHHAATTALRTATKSDPKTATGTLGMNWDCILDTSASNSAVHGSIPPPPASFMMPSRQIKEVSFSEGNIAIAPPALITIEDDSQYPSLPLSTSNATGPSFLPWVDGTEAPVSDMREETDSMDVEDDLTIPEWSKNGEEFYDGNNMSPIGAKDGALEPSSEHGDDDLSVISTSFPTSTAIAIAEDDLSSCPSINCDGQDDALIPFINY